MLSSLSLAKFKQYLLHLPLKNFNFLSTFRKILQPRKSSKNTTMASRNSTQDSNNLANPQLLRKIDELREKNVGQHVPLPQVRISCDLLAISPPTSKSLKVPDILIWFIARRCRRPKLWQIVFVGKFNEDPVSS